MRVLFICTGNTCRSPMAEALANQWFKEQGLPHEAVSAGLSAYGQTPPSANAIEAMAACGLDISGRKAASVTCELLTEADIVLTMTERHKDVILLYAGEVECLEEKTFTLAEYAVRADACDVNDPFGGDMTAYKACAAQLQEYVTKACDRFAAQFTRRKKNMIGIGCDHTALLLKKEILAELDRQGLTYRDFGTHSTESVDYPVYAKLVAQAVLSGECDKGILICGTGIGISITANRLPGIRAALCHDVFSAKATRQHNDANILAMGARVIGPGLAIEIVNAFLQTPFSNEERHLNRIRQIER